MKHGENINNEVERIYWQAREHRLADMAQEGYLLHFPPESEPIARWTGKELSNI